MCKMKKTKKTSGARPSHFHQKSTRTWSAKQISERKTNFKQKKTCFWKHQKTKYTKRFAYPVATREGR